jgi:hypothetical protein
MGGRRHHCAETTAEAAQTWASPHRQEAHTESGRPAWRWLVRTLPEAVRTVPEGRVEALPARRLAGRALPEGQVEGTIPAVQAVLHTWQAPAALSPAVGGLDSSLQKCETID